MTDHPVYATWTGELKRSRLTTFLRPILVIPHLLWNYLYAAAAGFAFFAAFFVSIFTGRVPKGLHSFIAGHQKYIARVGAYMLFLANEYPPFSTEDPYPVNIVLPELPEKQSRLGIFFRFLLAFPIQLLFMFYAIGLYVTTALAWFAILFIGRMPSSFQRYGLKCHQFGNQLTAYVNLLTNRYPSASGNATLVGPDGDGDGSYGEYQAA